MNPGGSLKLRDVVDKHCAALLDDLTRQVDSELQATRAQVAAEVAEVAAEIAEQERLQAASEFELLREKSIRETRLSTAEALNQALRRIRQAATEADSLSILLEGSAPFARRAVVVRVENNQAELLTARGLETSELSFSVETAGAVASVCESRDPMVALASAAELSPELAAALATHEDPSPKAYLFPVVTRQNVVAILIACGEPVPAAIELLSEAAGMKIDALEPDTAPVAALKPLPNPGLVQISSAYIPQGEGPDRLSWSDLSPEDQKLHLQAQRVARVKVAEMRLYHADALRNGVAEANIYGSLGNEIARARADFLQAFLSKSPTMVDYLHLEILRSLAHDDDRLLGQDYPGPMV